MGRIGAVLATLETGRTPLQEEVGRVVRTIAAVGLLLCAALVVLYGLTRGNWLQGLLAGIALAMAVLPEEFPVVLTIFMALGAWRISRSRVLTRRLPAVEALGAATVLCSDKTGTLTENRMGVARLWAPGTLHVVGEGPLPEERPRGGGVRHPREPARPVRPDGAGLPPPGRGGAAGHRAPPRRAGSWCGSTRSRRSSSPCPRSGASPDGERLVVAAKGAPEAIADVCHLEAASAAEVRRTWPRWAPTGSASWRWPAPDFGRGELPPGQHDFDFELVGLVGLEDPVRAGVPAAVAECAEAGVRVVMITGDSPDTARAIARQVGLPAGDGGHHRARSSRRSRTRSCAAGCGTRRSSPAWCRSRSCGSSRRSAPMARSWP